MQIGYSVVLHVLSIFQMRQLRLDKLGMRITLKRPVYLKGAIADQL